MIEIKDVYEKVWNGSFDIYVQDENPTAYVSSDMIALIKATDAKVKDGREYCHITLTRIVVNAGSASFDLYTKMTPAEIMSLMSK